MEREVRVQQAVAAVRQNRLSLRKASVEYGIPKTTLSDKVNSKWKKASFGPERQLSDEDETALTHYLAYMSKHGFPLTRAMARCFIKALVERSGRQSLFNTEKGPSDQWFRKFFGRHPELSERKPQDQDHGRAAMSNAKIMNQYFSLLDEVLTKNGIKDKPSQIFNCDETGWTGKEAARTKVIGSRDSSFTRKRVSTTEHVTAHLCVCADGRFLPSMIIYKGSLPHRNYKDGIPSSWAFAKSESGYMDTDLFVDWFVKVFVPHCGRERPVLLVMDNHDSHISLKLVENAIANSIVLVGLPAHTTHLLQPLDLKLIGPLKNRFSAVANNLGFTCASATVSKARFPVVLKYAIDKATPCAVQEAFAEAGLCPYSSTVIPAGRLIPPSFSSEKATCSNDIETSSNTVSTCETCGSFLTNPLVVQGLIPQRLADLFVPPPVKPLSEAKKKRLVTDARVLTGEEMLMSLKEKEERALAKKEAHEQRQIQREEKKKQKEQDEKEKAIKREKRKIEKEKKAEEKRRKLEEKKQAREIKLLGELDSELYICSVCSVRGRVNDERMGILWYGCDESLCQRWYHFDCLSESERNYLSESLDDTSEWYCKTCKPWLYDEE